MDVSLVWIFNHPLVLTTEANLVMIDREESIPQMC